MENNEIMKETSAKIVRLDKSNTCFAMKNGFLSLTFKGDDGEKQYDRVFLHRAFPHELLFEYISVLDDEKKEIGIIYNVTDFPSEGESLIKEELEKKYYSPIISEIKSVKERYGFSYWKVTLEDGREVNYTMQDTFRNIIHIGDDCLVLVDVDTNRYTIKSVSELSTKSYRKIELYL